MTVWAQTFTARKEQLQAGLENQIKVWTNAGIFGGDFEQNVNKAKELLVSATDSTGLDAYLQKYRLLNAEFKSFKIDSSMWNQLAKSNVFDTNLETAQLRIKNLKTEYSSFVSDPALRKQWRRLFDQSKIVSSEKELTNLNASIDQFEQKLISAGKHGPGMLAQMAQNAQKMAVWMVMGTGIATIISGIKGIYTNVVNLDTAMVELKKVTDETNSAYNNFLDNAAKRAVKLGASISDLTNATADFARLGDYSVKEAELLAENAIIYGKVGDQVNGVSGATSSIITAMKAFDVAAKDSISIVDKYNEVGKRWFHHGGVVGGQSVTTQDQKDLLAYLRPDEMVLTSSMQKTALDGLKTSSNLTDFVDKIKESAAQIDVMKTMQSSFVKHFPFFNMTDTVKQIQYLQPYQSKGFGDISIEFNVAGSMDESLIPKFKQEIYSTLSDITRHKYK